MTGDILDARGRFPGPDVPVAIPMDPHDAIDLDRLRLIESQFPQLFELLAELVTLRIVAREAATVAAKVAEHERCGYGHIAIGTFDKLRKAVAAWRRL